MMSNGHQNEKSLNSSSSATDGELLVSLCGAGFGSGCGALLLTDFLFFTGLLVSVGSLACVGGVALEGAEAEKCPLGSGVD